jgi:transposase, IS5 family
MAGHVAREYPDRRWQLGGKMLHSIGLARATLHLNWKAAAYNLRRLCYLKEAKIPAF